MVGDINSLNLLVPDYKEVATAVVVPRGVGKISSCTSM